MLASAQISGSIMPSGIQQTGLASLRALVGASCYSGSSSDHQTHSSGIAAVLTAAAAGVATLAAASTASDAPECANGSSSSSSSKVDQHVTLQVASAPLPYVATWINHILHSSSGSSGGSSGGSIILQAFRAAADSTQQPPPQQQQQQQAAASAAWSSSSGSSGSNEPLSGAIAALDEQGLTNHPLDYNPITNEHTAAMTLAKQAGIEAYQAGRYAEAERRFKEAIEEARAGFPPNDPHIPSAMHYLAEFYRNVGQLDKAEPLYREAISSLSDSVGERHWMYSAALCSLAALHEARGEYQQALALLETALELRRQLFSSGSFLYADTAALLARTLMQAHNAAAAAAAAVAAVPAAGPPPDSSSSSSDGVGSSKRGGWLRGLFGGSSRSSSSSSQGGSSGSNADVLRAIKLWQQAIQIVEDSGSVVDTPVVPWLLDLAAAQQTAGQPAAAVDSLKKALEYMALPQQQHEDSTDGGSSGSNGSNDMPQQQQQQQQLSGIAALPDGGSSGSGGSDSDTVSAVVAASGGDMTLVRLKLAALGSETAERLVDAQLAAGDLQGARTTLRQALEARIALHGRHLVVAKTMTRMSNLLMMPPADPSAPQLAPHFAASAVAISDAALQTAQRANLWWGMLRGALKAVSTAQVGGGYKAKLEAERSSDRLLAAVQLGNACLALAAAEKMNGRLTEAESTLRHAVGQLRWVLGVGAADLQRLSGSDVEPAMLQRTAGLLVDLKLLQMDCLEALAATLRETAAAEAEAPTAAAAASATAAAVGGSSSSSSSSGSSTSAAAAGDEDQLDSEVLMLLGEAELLAAELYAD